MKASDYVEKYMLDIKSNDDFHERMQNMFSAFAGEFTEICTARHVKTLSGQEGVVRELNEKWNAVADRVEKLYKKPLVKRNAVWNLFLSEIDPVKWPPK